MQTFFQSKGCRDTMKHRMATLWSRPLDLASKYLSASKAFQRAEGSKDGHLVAGGQAWAAHPLLSSTTFMSTWRWRRGMTWDLGAQSKKRGSARTAGCLLGSCSPHYPSPPPLPVTSASLGKAPRPSDWWLVGLLTLMGNPSSFLINKWTQQMECQTSSECFLK